jgi:sulfur carrier protein
VTRLWLNGEPAEMASPVTPEAIVEHLGCGRRGVAVAVNSEVVPRSSWAEFTIKEGDRVEVLGAAAGG